MKWLDSVIKEIKRSGRRLSGTGTFGDYIVDTKKAWWGGKHEQKCSEGLSTCIDTLFCATDSETAWRCCPCWQRRMTNKLNGRMFAMNNGVPVPDLYWHGKDVNAIPFASLPPAYVIKTSFGASSKQVVPVVGGRDIFKDLPCSEESIRQFFSHALADVQPYGYVMVEEFLTPDEGTVLPTDYKCYVFDGRVAFVSVINRATMARMWYTRDWQAVTFNPGHTKFIRASVEPRPAQFDELIHYAEKLGRNYGRTFVRIDFLLAQKGFVFGEFTATPSGGKGYSPIAEQILGELWRAMPDRQSHDSW